MPRVRPALFSLAAALGFIGGCGGGPPAQPLQHTTTVEAPLTAGQPADQAAAIPRQDLAPVKLGRVEISIPSDSSVGTYQFQLGRCAPRFEEGVYAWGGRRSLDDAQFYAGFHEALRRADYIVADGGESMFERDDETAEYVVGGDIVHVSVSLCDRVNRWTGRRVGGQEGTGSVTVNWEVYSTLSRSVVYRTRTDGVASLHSPVPRGATVLLHRAFRDAARTLAADPKFRESLKRGRIEAVAGAAPRQTISVPRYRPYARPFTANSSRIVRASVTIDLSAGHGSGFFVTRGGLLLTNQHVVGDADTVRVRLFGGTSIRGKVLRRDAARDVALIKVDAEETQPLPLRFEPLAVGEEVYAIGTPARPDLTATVTKGIVSAVRRHGPLGLPIIQADVDIHGGSSGGPLVDRHGNVVGITVAGFAMGAGKRSSGLNVFIPIADALEHLDIAVADPRPGPGT